ncbi:MAG: hypothetical protein WD060_07145 [Pirellulales bacterium]
MTPGSQRVDVDRRELVDVLEDFPNRPGRGGKAGVSQAALKHDPFAGAAVSAVFCHVPKG